MTRLEFDALVRRLEKRAEAAPRLQKWKTAFWAGFGFTYLVSVIALCLALAGFGAWLVVWHPSAGTFKIALLLILAFGGLSLAIIRSLFIKVDKPAGLEITREECPELFAMIDDLREQLHSSSFHHVLLTGEHNAGVVQIPRLGVFGWHRNFLLLGLPLMQGISVEEFRAVLAHEFAHLSGSHGKMGMWIYRLRRSWEQIFERLEAEQRGSFLLSKFVGWFWPRFNARAFVLSRVQEYEADGVAARLVGAGAMSQALVRTNVQGRWLEEKFWPTLFESAKDQPTPPEEPFRHLADCLNGLHAEPETARLLKQAFTSETSTADTHPCLRDRLGALLPGGDVRTTELLPIQPHESAVGLLGGRGEMLTRQLSRDWLEMVSPHWTEQHATAQKVTAELAALQPADGAETAESLWHRIDLICQRDGDANAEDLLHRLLALEPKHVGGNLVLGRLLLSRDDAAGVPLLERAMTEDPTATEHCCSLLYGYYDRTGQHAKLQQLASRLDSNDELMEASQTERSDASDKDTFLPHELTAEEQQDFRKICESFPQVQTAFIARKQVRHLPERPMYVAAVTLKLSFFTLSVSDAEQRIVNGIVEALRIDGSWIILANRANNKAACKKVMQIPGAEVYKRQSSS